MNQRELVGGLPKYEKGWGSDASGVDSQEIEQQQQIERLTNGMDA
jgi:hypothetical protein